MNNRGIKRLPLSKQVADELERMIKAGEYEVGQKIPTETELMDMFQVSRNTLREAVQSLTSVGVLSVKQGDGTYVRSNSRFNANMEMEYEQVSLEDIWEVRRTMEISLARLCAAHRTDEDLAEITSALRKRQELKENEKENTLADMEFHMAIARGSHNKILMDLYQSVSSYLESQIAQRQAETEMNWMQIDGLHTKLYLAIRNQEPEVAVVYAKEILEI